MKLDDEKSASELLNTQHQINTFVLSIKQLKTRNGRKMSLNRRRQQSRRGQSLQLQTLNTTSNAASSTSHVLVAEAPNLQ